MKILYVADGRSAIALNWMRHFVAAGHEVHLVSLYPCDPALELASLTVAPVAFSQLVRPVERHDGSRRPQWSLKQAILQTVGPPRLRTALRQRIVPLTLPRAAGQIRRLVEKIQPDLIHAMRIPYEGMAAALAAPDVPLLVSVWGNDFTLHASSTRRMTRLTRVCMQSASALHTDCQRDQRLAKEWGFPRHRPAVVLPGGGGVRLDVFYPRNKAAIDSQQSDGQAARPIVINPRGMRAYVRNDTFFRAARLVLTHLPDVRFTCPAMAGSPEARHWLSALDLEGTVELLPALSQAEIADRFRQALVVVSPTTHDGTPNSLLEAMACGCFPVAGDLEPLREWITSGENGLLVDPADAEALARAILVALQDPDLRRRAERHNLQQIQQRAEYQKVMDQAERFCDAIVRGIQEDGRQTAQM